MLYMLESHSYHYGSHLILDLNQQLNIEIVVIPSLHNAVKVLPSGLWG